MSEKVSMDVNKSVISKHTTARLGRTLISSTSSDATQTEKELAQKALTEFNKGIYTQGINALTKLENSRPKDIKVLHNKAVCEYYKSGLTNTGNFRRVLTDIIAQSSNSKGHGRLPEWAGSVESSVAALNLAVLYYYQQQFVLAIDLLTPLYDALESLEESVGISVCLLLACSYLSCSRPDNTLSVVGHTEATFLPHPLPVSPTPAAIQQQQPQPSPANTPTHNTTTTRDGASSASGNTESEQTRAGGGGGGVKEGSADQEALRRHLQVLRVRAYVALRLLKPASREYKQALLLAVNAGNDLELSQICVKSQLKFLRGQHLKALKVLNTCVALPRSVTFPSSSTLRRAWPSLEVWYYNNLAVIHLGLNKPTLATVYLERAVKKYISDCKQKNGDKASLYDSKSSINGALCYNLGCTLLRLNKSAAMARKAFEFFIEALQSHPNNPRLWLHLAQCCIAVHHWNLSESRSVGITVKTLGVGASTKLLVCPPQPPHFTHRRSSESPSDAAFPEARLEFARLCLLNALKLLPPPPAAAAADLEDHDEIHQASPSLPMRGAEAQCVRCAVLASASYTSLCLAEYQPALQHATALLASLPSDPSTSPQTSPLSASLGGLALPTPATYRMLGKLYASECCVMLNRLTDAAKYLELSDIQEAASQPPTPAENDNSDNKQSPFDSGCFPHTSDEQLMLLKFNLSVVYAIRQDYDKSSSLLNDIWCRQPGSKAPALIMLALYLQIKQGQIEKARSVVGEHLLPR
uniref:CCR4-NOT transcription complex subunit 10 n=1 Tax=Hirondellea gigas TaxID=1518452 RepID=A0A2P2I4Q7_9CRUS